MKVLIVGSGGREHCLAWKVSKSPLVKRIYCAPGNGGTSLVAENVDIAVSDINGLLEFALENKIDFTIIGPEAPLVAGIVDIFEERGLKIFGPKKDLALLEGSKVFAKETMQKFGIPTAEFKTFSDSKKAKEYIEAKDIPLVVKADGLAAGKGVVVCKSKDEAFGAIDSIMVDKVFLEAGDRVIIEDCLEGEEVSVLIFTDGNVILPMVSSQDHKRAFDGDEGPNTGGMGAYAPASFMTGELLSKIMQKVFIPLIEGLKKEDKPYKGILYGGLMVKDNEPYVLEFNVRFGDPETQAILPKLESDLFEVMLKSAEGRLAGTTLKWDGRYCVCVVLVSGGYPSSYEKGKQIKGLEALEGADDIFVFHAGTKKRKGFITNGGRVLGLVALGDTIARAQKNVYQAVEKIEFDKMHYRKDIGNKAFLGCSQHS